MNYALDKIKRCRIIRNNAVDYCIAAGAVVPQRVVDHETVYHSDDHGTVGLILVHHRRSHIPAHDSAVVVRRVHVASLEDPSSFDPTSIFPPGWLIVLQRGHSLPLHLHLDTC